MICEHCGGDSAVINSRVETSTNVPWRRRRCLSCGRAWSTVELATTAAWMERRLCLEDGCRAPAIRNRARCREHHNAKKRESDRQLAMDMKYKERTCKNHPDKKAVSYQTSPLCLECMAKRRAEHRRKRRAEKNVRANVPADCKTESTPPTREDVRDMLSSEKRE